MNRFRKWLYKPKVSLPSVQLLNTHQIALLLSECVLKPSELSTLAVFGASYDVGSLPRQHFGASYKASCLHKQSFSITRCELPS